MTSPLRVGDVLYGFCEGYFGRDSYNDKRVEGIGTDWVVARDISISNGTVAIAFGPPDYLTKFRTPTGDHDG